MKLTVQVSLQNYEITHLLLVAISLKSIWVQYPRYNYRLDHERNLQTKLHSNFCLHTVTNNRIKVSLELPLIPGKRSPVDGQTNSNRSYFIS